MWYWSCGGHAATNTACLVLIWRHAPVWAGTRRDSSPVKTREVFKKREMEKSHNPILSLKCFCCTLILYRPRRESCVRSIKTQAASLQSSLPLNQVGFSSNEAEYYFSLKRTSLWEKKGKVTAITIKSWQESSPQLRGFLLSWRGADVIMLQRHKQINQAWLPCKEILT